jgi:hypothetical protein
MYRRFINAVMAARFSSAAIVPAALLVVIGPALVAGSAVAAVSAPQAGSTFDIESISCASAGNCSAVGANRVTKEFFAVSEKHGIWGAAQAVPGQAAVAGSRPSGGSFSVVSCSSAANCSAGGSYTAQGKSTQAFVVSEKNGTWGKLEPVRLASGRGARLQAVSCPSAGNCGAGGSYTIHGAVKAFVVSEKHGVWGKGEEIPGNSAGFDQIACTSAGNCLGVGFYFGSGSAGLLDPFAVTEKNGTWGKARTFPRLNARADGPGSELTRVACESAGNCTAVGYYYFDGNQNVAFAFSQKNGIWGPITALNSGLIDIGSLSCSSQGNCAAGGDFVGETDPELAQAWIATEKDGVWGGPQVPPGLDALSGDSMESGLTGVVCWSAGHCGAAGDYAATSGSIETYVTTEKNGVWDTATELPRAAALTGSPLPPAALSCGAPGNCSLGGSFTSSVSGQSRPFVAMETNGIWGDAQPVKGVAP